MIREFRPSLFTRVLVVPCLALLMGCVASNENADDNTDAAPPRVDGNGSVLVPDAAANKDTGSPLNKDTATSQTPSPDASQPRADLAVPDTAASGKDAGPETPVLLTDAMVALDTSPARVDTGVRDDASARADLLPPDSSAKGSDTASACNPVTPAPALTSLSPKELKAILDSSEDVYLINVKGSSIANIPGTDAVLASDVPGIEALVGKNLCANIIIYCRSGVTSQTVGNQLVAKGYQHVRDLSGGINAWTAAGYATE